MPETERSEELKQILSLVEAFLRRGAAPVLLFDLDDTLLLTAYRHVRILREYASLQDTRGRYLEEAWKIVQIEPHQVRYSIPDTLKANGIEHPEVHQEVKSFWFARFFTNDYLSADEPVAGGPRFCREAREKGATLVYLTGRDESMREGTEASLAKHGFPVPDGKAVRLILKPRFDTPDLEFKAQVLKEVARLGPVAAGFENEPAHINLFADAFPQGRMVLLDTKHSGKPVLPYPSVARLPDYL